VGFALLILLIFFLSQTSVLWLEDTSRQVLDIEHQHTAKTTLLLELRVALTRLDDEARDRMEAEGRRELKPIFDLRLDTARGDLNRLLAALDHAPLTEMPKWRELRGDLEEYVEVTRHLDRYALEGFTRFRRVDTELNDLLHDSSAEQEQIFEQSEAMQRASARRIRLWSVIAVVAGLVVAAATIWGIQRRFGQMRRRRAEARREREFSNQMLEGMVSALAAIDCHDRIRSANAAFFRIFPRLKVGVSLHDGSSSREGEKMLEAATASIVEEATYRGRWNLNENSDQRTYDLYSSPLLIEGERGQLLNLVDVTGAAQAEELLRRSASLAAVGQAAAHVAHEIRNPLASIRLGVAMLRESAKNEEAQKTISLVERGIDHLNKLVVDVTRFARPTSLYPSEVDLHQLLDASLELVQNRIHEKATPIEKSYAPKAICGVWDDDQLRMVFANVLANAIDASEPKSPVRISTELVPDARGVRDLSRGGDGAPAIARIVFRDQGSGMDEKTRAHLFEPFFTTKKRGSGLGLAIVKQIIDAHGGAISVKSEVGKGTSFALELPLEAPNRVEPSSR
jgi:signal transduction histidine kinase